MEGLEQLSAKELAELVRAIVASHPVCEDMVAARVGSSQAPDAQADAKAEEKAVSGAETTADAEAPTSSHSHAEASKRKQKKQRRRQNRDEHNIIDMTRYHQRHVAMQLQYDGGPYYGFASQVGECDDTVEKHLFEALAKTRLAVDKDTCNYSRCGRTDKGVSALGQVVNLRLRSSMPQGTAPKDVPRHPCDALVLPPLPPPPPSASTDQQPGAQGQGQGQGQDKKKKKKAGAKEESAQRVLTEMDYCTLLNRCLPSEIRVLGWTEVTPDFNSRFSASSRKYRYFFPKKALNLPRMRQAAALLLGEHDFRNFCKMNIGEVSNFRREVYSADIIEFMPNAACDERSMCMLEIEGLAFLWHMVRCIMAVLYLVGEGYEQPEVVLQLLDVEANPGKPYYNMAAEAPLVLHECSFENLHIHWAPKVLWDLTDHYERMYEKHAVAAAQALNNLQFVKSRRVRPQDLQTYAVAATTASKDSKESCGGSGGGSGGGSAASVCVESAEGGTSASAEPPAKKVKIDTDTQQRQWSECLVELEEKWGLRYPFPSTALQGNAGSSGGRTCTRARYIPMMQRATGVGYETRVAQAGGGRKVRLERHMEMKESNDRDGLKFFSNMRSQGSVE